MIILPGKWKQWTVTEEIGSGSFGTVYKAENTENSEVAAIKVIPVIVGSSVESLPENEETYDRDYCFSIFLKYNQEIAIMQQLKNKDNIVKIIDSHVQENKNGNGWTIYIMMEYLRNISDIMMGWDQVKEKDVAKLGVDICKAIEACAEQNIIHRDIKPENILVSEEGTYKLGDFGVAKHIEQTIATASIQGTYSFMAPEIIQMKKYSKKVDVYSLGMILYRFMNRNRDPFVDLNKKIIFYQDKEASMERRLKGEELPSPVDASEEFAEIILKACEYSAEDRYDIEEFKSDLLKFIAGKYRLKKKKGKKTRYYNISNKNIKRWIVAAACLVVCIVGSFLYYIQYNESFEFKDSPFGQNGRCSLRNGTLVIEGEWGDIISGSYPWRGYEDKIEKVELVGNITDIGYEAFKGCRLLKSITGMENVTAIEYDAFSGCDSLERIEGLDFSKSDGIRGDVFDDTPWLESHTENGFFIVDDTLIRYSGKEENIKLPEKITMIESGAFAECNSIKSITELENVTEIGDCAFENCYSLESITGLENVTVLGYGAFSGCLSLERIEGLDLTKIDDLSSETFDTTPWLESHSENGFFIVDHTLVRYSGNEENIKIPESVTIIGNSAFEGCESLESITGMENIKEIGNQAFAECRLLESISGLKNIKEIGIQAFYDCASLKRLESLDFSKMNHISGDAFDLTPWLESHTENGFFIVDDRLIRYSGEEEHIQLPDSVRKIGDSAFEACYSLKKVTGLENVTKIGENAFSDCSNLESVSGMEKVSEIGNGAFDNTPWLKSNSENGFFILDDTLIRYSGKDGVIKLPDSVRKIGNYAFVGCNNLESVSGMENVTEIGEFAFLRCRCLESISGLDHVSKIGGGSFEMCYSLKKIEGKKKNEILERDDLGLEDTKVFEKQ